MKNQTELSRKSDREYVATRSIDASSRAVFEAWTKPAIFKTWWVPKSAPISLEACDMDIRVGGKYRLQFRAGEQTMEFFGKYLEVTPPLRLVWTNEEGEDSATITTVTFQETNGTTLVTVHDLYPSKESLDEAISSGACGGLPEQLEQLSALF